MKLGLSTGFLKFLKPDMLEDDFLYFSRYETAAMWGEKVF